MDMPIRKVKMMQSNENEVCISGRYTLYFIKYGVLPFCIIILAVNYIGLVTRAYSGKLLEILVSIAIVCLIIVAIMLFLRCKLIYMDESGFLIDSVHIPWSIVENVFFPFISPPSIVIKYRISTSSIFVFSLLPYIHDKKVKNGIRQKIADKI